MVVGKWMLWTQNLNILKPQHGLWLLFNLSRLLGLPSLERGAKDPSLPVSPSSLLVSAGGTGYSSGFDNGVGSREALLAGQKLGHSQEARLRRERHVGCLTPGPTGGHRTSCRPVGSRTPQFLPLCYQFYFLSHFISSRTLQLLTIIFFPKWFEMPL